MGTDKNTRSSTNHSAVFPPGASNHRILLDYSVRYSGWPLP